VASQRVSVSQAGELACLPRDVEKLPGSLRFESGVLTIE
jgi:hypothetical protein